MDDRVSVRFPSLSQLMNIEEDTLRKVLKECKLVQKNSKATGTRFLSPALNAWDSFIMEYGLDMEWTQLKVDGKQHFFLRIGSWSNSWPSVTPGAVLRQMCKPPLLRISRINMLVAASIGEMELGNVLDPSTMEGTLNNNTKSCITESSSDSEEESDIEAEEEVSIAPENDATNAKLADPLEFPFLHSLGICTEKEMDRLVQEVLKFHGNDTIKFKRRNNREGKLLLLPFATSVKRYDEQLSKRTSIINRIVESFANNCNCSIEESASCILRALCNKYEDSFLCCY